MCGSNKCLRQLPRIRSQKGTFANIDANTRHIVHVILILFRGSLDSTVLDALVEACQNITRRVACVRACNIEKHDIICSKGVRQLSISRYWSIGGEDHVASQARALAALEQDTLCNEAAPAKAHRPR